ncbi:hypothetical protein TNCV_2105301 [Trichonephila clavipes]|nr:hypothetical protein TNCV_2105301 [Trichonephila clavipes]
MFYTKSCSHTSPIVQFLKGHTNQKKSHSSNRKSSKPLKWNENAEQTFLAAKNTIAEVTLLRHPIPGAQLSLWVDASDNAIGGTLSQLAQGKWEPIAFFSMKLNKNLISRYSTDIRHVQSSENTVADALSRIKIDSITKSPVLNFKEFALAQKNDPDLQKFLQTDIVGPLLPSEGHHYLLTIIDCFSRWPEAIPIPDMQAKTICRAIFDRWTSRFGCPSVITSDQGTQMLSSMYAEFTLMLGTEKIKTTTYPKSNGIVEHFHQHLKSAIKAHEKDTWSEIVPIILLGIQTAVKEDLQSCAEIVYGTNVRLPSDMIDVSIIPFCDKNFITNLCKRMQQLNPLWQHLLTALINSTFILHYNQHIISF